MDRPPTTRVVSTITPQITVEDALEVGGLSFGGKVVKINGAVLVEVRYVYPWTDNASVAALAEKIANMLRGEATAQLSETKEGA